MGLGRVLRLPDVGNVVFLSNTLMAVAGMAMQVVFLVAEGQTHEHTLLYVVIAAFMVFVSVVAWRVISRWSFPIAILLTAWLSLLAIGVYAVFDIVHSPDQFPSILNALSWGVISLCLTDHYLAAIWYATVAAGLSISAAEAVGRLGEAVTPIMLVSGVLFACWAFLSLKNEREIKSQRAVQRTLRGVRQASETIQAHLDR